MTTKPMRVHGSRRPVNSLTGTLVNATPSRRRSQNDGQADEQAQRDHVGGLDERIHVERLVQRRAPRVTIDPFEEAED
jgi:hypothetical protein